MTSGPTLSLTVRNTRSGTWITARGEIDVATAPRFEAMLDAAARRRGAILVDMRSVTFVDSAALHALMRACRQAPGRLRVRPSHACERLFEIAGVGNLVPLQRRRVVAGI
jgi:anti-anti-sigma factor